MDPEAQIFGFGLYEAAVDGRTWALGDPLYTEEHLAVWAEYFIDALPDFGLVSEIDSRVVLAQAPLGPDGRRQLVFEGPITIAAVANDPGDHTGIFFRSDVTVRAVIDQATGHLVEVSEIGSLTGGDQATVMTHSTTVLRANCRSEPVD